MEKVSIVLLTYNNYEKFVRCMSSMFAFIHDKRIKEFIILDNGSYQVELKEFLTDMENQIKKFKVIFSNENLGIGRGRKLLFDMATGDYIISLDSDVVILNPMAFLEVYFKALSIDKMMLVGGGGGNHPYFPSMERENIDNKDSPDSPEELKVVDEVAGWFTGFKSSILKKNGGQIEMDEQFSPFWAEDSDFCVQIKLVGGKCCIMGKGLVAHQWSSCGKKETQTTLEEMWCKFQTKWYTIFGKKFNFSFDKDFYEENYPEAKKLFDKKEFYLKVGILRGDVHSKNVITDIFKNVKFKNNTTLEYEDKTYSVKEFAKNKINYESILVENFKVVGSNFQKCFEDLILLVAHDEDKCLRILKSLVAIQKNHICICLTEEMRTDVIINFCMKFDVRFFICFFTPYKFDLVPFVFCYNEMRKNYIFNRVLNLSTHRNQDLFLNNRLNEIQTGSVVETNVKKIDHFNISLLGSLIILSSEMNWNKECVFLETTKYYDILFKSYPFKSVFNKCLFITQYYDNYVTPRCSPFHSLERIFSYMKNIITEKKSLLVLTAEINGEDDIDKIKNNLKYYKNCEILIFNKGSLKHINIRKLNCDYYYTVNEESDDYELWKNCFGIVKLENYNNIIFSKNNFSIESNIDEFLERSRFKNMCFLQEDEFDLSLFSIMTQSVGVFVTQCEEYLKKEKEPNLMKEIKKNVFKKVNMTSVWKTDKTEDDNEIVLEYSKTENDNGEDFPMTYDN